jgi:hypothetical protein
VRAAEALKAARAAGVELSLDGDDMVLEAPAPPPTEILNLLSRHKPAIVMLLRPAQDGWSAADWQAFYDEHSVIAESDGCLPGGEAEARAFACCVVEWMNRNPIRSAPDRCCWCGGDELEHDLLLPHGVEPTGQAWLHSRCWPAWYDGRKAGAVAALKAMGVTPRPDFPNDFEKNGDA